jgi:hypothetical protein
MYFIYNFLKKRGHVLTWNFKFFSNFVPCFYPNILVPIFTIGGSYSSGLHRTFSVNSSSMFTVCTTQRNVQRTLIALSSHALIHLRKIWNFRFVSDASSGYAFPRHVRPMYTLLLKIYEYDIYIYIFNRSWVDTRWQQYITHLHTNSTHNTEIRK